MVLPLNIQDTLDDDDAFDADYPEAAEAANELPNPAPPAANVASDPGPRQNASPDPKPEPAAAPANPAPASSAGSTANGSGRSVLLNSAHPIWNPRHMNSNTMQSCIIYISINGAHADPMRIPDIRQNTV